MVDIDIDIDDDKKEEDKRIDISPARVMAHIDWLTLTQTCHFPIADNKENRKIFECSGVVICR